MEWLHSRTPESLRKAALEGLRVACESFSDTRPNTREEEQLAERIIDGVVFDQFGFKLSSEDIAAYKKDIDMAGKIVAMNLVGEASIYKGILEEMKKTGTKKMEGERFLKAKGHLPSEEAFYRLKLMTEMGVLDIKRFPHVSFLRDEARREIRLYIEAIQEAGKGGKKSDYPNTFEDIYKKFEEYKALGFLSDEKDSDLLEHPSLRILAKSE